MSKAIKAWKDGVASLGCVVCRNMGYGESPAHLHHLRHGMGMGQRNDDWHIIPLCPYHHQRGNYGEAFHAGPREFERKFGTEMDLWAQVCEEMLETFGVEPQCDQ